MTGRAGLALVAEVADTIGLTAALSQATGHARSWAVHDPGVVLRDVALTLADGGDALRHMAVLAGQPELFDVPASPATASRTIVAVAENARAMAGLAGARAAARGAVWAAGGAPPVVAAAADDEVDDPDEPLCLDLDATISVAHSDDKDGAAATYKRTWGFHPMMAYLDRGDGGGEALAGLLRPGNAGANDAADHVTTFDLAREQLPQLPAGLQLLVRTDSAGASHRFLGHVRACGWRFSTGFALTSDVKDAIRVVDDDAWVPATRQDGAVRAGAHVADITDLVDISNWPTGSRLIVRREPLHPGAQQTLADVDGWRFHAILTNIDADERDAVAVEAHHRARGGVPEDAIRQAKNGFGFNHAPVANFFGNWLWQHAAVLAYNVAVWIRRIALPEAFERCRPKRLRLAFFNVAARVTRHARRWHLKFDRAYRWADAFAAAVERLHALPAFV